MALRWRENGDLLCAAKCRKRKTDTYINDRLHYELSVELKVVVPSAHEHKTGRWYWIKDTFLVARDG